jgi:hypothetical protein
MLRIRKEQNDELAKVALKRFEDDMVAHVKEFFPRHYEILEEPTIREVIQYGVERGEDYGFTTERDVCLYINLMLLLGSNFDTDVQYPWAGEILNDETITDPVTRIDQLYDTATDYLDRVAGPNDQYVRRALLNMRQVPIQDFSETATENVERILLSRLQKIWPTKCGELGGTTLHALIRHSTESAQNYGITGDRGVATYTGLAFILGAGFDTDPQFVRASAILKDESIPDEATKVARLYKEAMIFLEKALA